MGIRSWALYFPHESVPEIDNPQALPGSNAPKYSSAGSRRVANGRQTGSVINFAAGLRAGERVQDVRGRYGCGHAAGKDGEGPIQLLRGDRDGAQEYGRPD